MDGSRHAAKFADGPTPRAAEDGSPVPQSDSRREARLNWLIFLGFRDGDEQSAKLSPKNGVLDNGRYHERQTLIANSGRT